MDRAKMPLGIHQNTPFQMKNHLYNFFPSLSYFVEFGNVYELKNKFAIVKTYS